MKNDLRLQVGASVHKVARYVANTKTECANVYGRNWNTKNVEGHVRSVNETVQGGRKKRTLSFDCAFGPHKSRKKLPLGQVKLHPYPLRNGNIPEREIELSYTLEESKSESENGVASQRSKPAETNEEQNDVSKGVHVHGVLWKEAVVSSSLNGSVPTRLWSITGPDGQVVTEGSIPMSMKPLDCFQWTFPMSFLSSIVQNTNKNLCTNHVSSTSAGEILKFFGIFLLMTRFSFGSRRDLWNRVGKHRFIPAPQFGRYMPFKIFEDLRKHISFCALKEQDTAEQTVVDDFRGEQKRWNLCEVFLNATNTHREQHFKPCEFICVDESISRWYGKGGSWLSEGIPHYVALDRKPENGCEIQSSACGRSGIAIRLAFKTKQTSQNL